MRAKQLFTVLFAIAIVTLLFSCGGGGGNTAQQTKTDAVATAPDLAAGQAIFEGKGTCVTCHQKDGKGVAGTFPPLAGSDYLLADKMRAVKQAIKGSAEPLTVNGAQYPGGIMTVVTLTDQEVMDVVNYALNSWGNKGGTVTLDDVKKVRESIK